MGLPPSSLVVARAYSDDDVLLACNILIEAADWLASSGQPLWNRESLTPANIRLSRDEGSIFLARLEGQPVGTFVLQFEDSTFWPDASPGEALYLHKLAVCRSAARTGLSHNLLDHATAEARSAGRKFLRLDCVIRPKLCAFYDSAGFHRHSDRTVGNFTVRRYERPIMVEA